MRERTVWELARMAECSDPDTDKSPGADFLRAIESSVADALREDHSEDDESWMNDAASEVADLCVPVYTHNLWATFVDLAAYSEELDDWMPSRFDGMESLPRLSLCQIGERLALALFQAEINEDEGEE